MDSTAFINCIKCNSEFDDTRRQPHVLSCLHTCCASCLNDLSSNTFFCPECRGEIELPLDGIQSLPIDTACRNYLDFIRVQRKPSEIACTDCPDDGLASTFCKDCFNFMCQECTSAHKRTQVTRKHVVVSLEDMKDSGMKDFQRKDTCNKPGHEDQVYTFYCDRRGCDIPVCTLCAVCDHNQTNGHLIRNLSDVYEDSKTVVQSVVREINARGTPMSEAVEQLESVVDELAETESVISKEIDAIFDKYQKVLNERRYQLQMEVQKHCQVKKRDLQEKVKNFKLYTTEVKTATDFTNRALLYTTATEFLNLKNIILRRILELKNVNVAIPAKDEVALKFMRGVSDDSFLQLIGSIGSVTSRDSPVSQKTSHIPNGHADISKSALLKSPLNERSTDARQTNCYNSNEGGSPKKTDSSTFQRETVTSQYTIPGTVDKTSKLEIQSSLPLNNDRLGDFSTVSMMNGLPSSPAEDRKSFFTKAKVPEDTPIPETEDSKPDGRPSPLKLDSNSQAMGLGDFLKNLEQKGELPIKNTEKHIQAARESFQQLSPDRPFQPVTSPLSPRTPPSIPPELQNIPGAIYGDVLCPEFTYDVLTIHNEREVSLDGKVLRNRKTGKPCSSAAAEKQLQHYKGIIGNFPFKEAGKYYYEIDVTFTIFQPLEQTWLVYELGICRKDDVDTHHTVERHEHARSCYVARYPEDGKLAHEFWHNRDLLTYVSLCDNTSGNTVNVTYGLLIDTKRRKWTVADVKKQKKLHTFTNVDFSEALWPVFGTYNPDLVSVEMTLRTGYEISAFPPFLKGTFPETTSHIPNGHADIPNSTLMNSPSNERSSSSRQANYYNSNEGSSPKNTSSLALQKETVTRQYSMPGTADRASQLERQTSLPSSIDRRGNLSTVAMMNGLPSSPAQERNSFFTKAKVSDDTPIPEPEDRKPDRRPSPLKLDSNSQPMGLGDFLRNLEQRGELPIQKTEKHIQAARESFQQLSPDRPFQPVTSPLSPRTPPGIPPELQNIPGTIYGDVLCPEFTYDVLTIHNEREVSLDGKVLRNRKTGKPCSSAAAEKQLQHYKGIIGNFPFKEAGKYYYEIDVTFTIFQPLEQTWLVYELGICRKDDVDTHHTVERHEHARSCYVARYPEDGKLAHEFWHNRDLLTYVSLCDNTSGNTVNVTYGLLIDTKRRKWTVADVKKQKKLHTFTNIDFSEALWPVFGTYNPDLVSVEMTLRTGSEISAFPPFLKGF